MKKQSAGILLYRRCHAETEVLLVHPGGPFWARRDLGAWSIPKGEFDGTEEPLAAAKREFNEEMGAGAPPGEYQKLGEFKQPSGKIVHTFCCNSDFDLEKFKSNMFSMEWPPKSGKQQEFPECDKAAWMNLSIARKKLLKGQVAILDTFVASLGLADSSKSDKNGRQEQCQLEV